MDKLLPTFTLALVTALISVGASAGEPVVKFTNVDDYTDFPYSESESLQKLISEHFIKQASSLPANVDLKVEILDVDLAGDIKANFRSPTDIRVRKGMADGPEIKVRFTLTENGKVILSGEDTLSDAGYLQRTNRYYNNDELRYEKQMIDDWMVSRLGIKL
jgi:hypothetical protein